MPAPSIVMQTTYAELLERCATTSFNDDFPDNGTFTSKTIKGRRYWYFQTATDEGRIQKYAGPETPELLERIAKHKEIHSDERERRALVSTLIRSFGLPRPIPEIGNVIAALARAGVFRLRGVLVGTVAYQAYAAMLGVKLPDAIVQTGDVDIAQFKQISVAVEDRTPPMLDVLKEVDASFRPIAHISDGRRVTSYKAKGGLRVDFLTPNVGPNTDAPQSLPAFGTDAEPLRFLDYLIFEPEPATVLHGAGIYVHIPAPERYAVHKLIVSRRRTSGSAKREKDLQQAEALLDVLAKKRPHELKFAWQEAFDARKWRRLLGEGVGQLSARHRDTFLKAVDGRRTIVPGLDLTFSNPPPRYDFRRDIVTFVGAALGAPVQCAISREALDDHFGTDSLDNEGRIKKFLENRSAIEDMARAKYLFWPIEDLEAVLIKTMDIPKLLKEMKSAKRQSLST